MLHDQVCYDRTGSSRVDWVPYIHILTATLSELKLPGAGNLLD